MKCPNCGSKNSAKIMYSLPHFNKELEQKLKSGELVPGGCCICGVDPKYYCNDCGKNYGKPPILVSKRGSEDYRDIVTSIRFYDGSYFNGYSEILIKKTKSDIIVEVKSPLCVGGDSCEYSLAQSEWNKIMDKLYCHIYIHEWKKRFVDPNVMDGEQWQLEISLTGGRKRTYYGDNAFPPLWSELKKVFRPLFKEVGIDL